MEALLTAPTTRSANRISRLLTPEPPLAEAQPAPPKIAPPAPPTRLEIYVPGSTFNPPDWRFRSARTLVEQGKKSDRLGRIPYLQRAYRLLARLDAGCLPEGLPANLKPLYRAFTIYKEDQPIRWVLEAAILANEDNKTIAARLGLDPVIVENYVKVFFSIREYLRQPPNDYIRAMVLSITPNPEPTIANVLRCFAYLSGPHELDALLTFFDMLQWRTPGAKVEKEDDLDLRVFLLTWIVPINSDHMSVEMLEMRCRLLEMDWAKVMHKSERRAYRRIQQSIVKILRLAYPAKTLRSSPLLQILLGQAKASAKPRS